MYIYMIFFFVITREGATSIKWVEAWGAGDCTQDSDHRKNCLTADVNSAEA